jgi:hypothetical protein
MVPCSYHWRSALPLTGNGKVDRKRLTELAAELEATALRANGAMTATERRLARAWADVLGIPAERIGSRDDFFALGGTSLSAVKLVVQLERAIGLKELSERPMLADMAAWLDDRSSRRSQNGSY